MDMMAKLVMVFKKEMQQQPEEDVTTPTMTYTSNLEQAFDQYESPTEEATQPKVEEEIPLTAE